MRFDYSFWILAGRYQQAIWFGSANRRSFVTDQGHVGMGPPGMQKGDFVCVPSGAKDLFVLRKEGGLWNLVGACYVHGIMQVRRARDSSVHDIHDGF